MPKSLLSSPATKTKCASNTPPIQVGAIDLNRQPTAFIDAQAFFYRWIAAARPRMAKFLKGWLNRLNDLRHFLNLE